MSTKIAFVVLMVTGLSAANAAYVPPLNPQPVSQATPSLLNATVVQGATPWVQNLTQVSGSALSASNAIPARITNGTSYVDPTLIRALTSADVVSAVQSGTWTVAVSNAILPTGAATSALQTSGNSSLSSIDTKVPALVSGRVPVDGSGVTQPVSSTQLPATLGAKTSVNSFPVVIASDQAAVPISQPDLLITGQSAQTALVNNIIPIASGATATDVQGYRSGSIQVVSTGTAGAFTLEGSNDNVNFVATPMFNQAILTGTPIVAPVTATASTLVYSFPIKTQYIRLRISTAITGGSIQAFSRFSQESWSPAVVAVTNATAANLNANVATVTTVTTLGSLTSANLGLPLTAADVASAAITTTTTTAAFTPVSGVGYVINIPVTVVSGTAPTYDVTVQESLDTGTNWTNVYTFPQIIATGFYASPPLYIRGNRVRYVQTVAGTTPSFTRAINRLQVNAVGVAPVNNNATYAQAAISAVTTLAAPANAVGFILQNLNSNTTTLRFNVGGTASASNGLQLEPARDSGFIPLGKNVSICPESGTITYSIQWVQQ